MTKVVLVHRWGGSPESDWYPWLKSEIEKRGAKMIIPQMPNPDYPQIEPWVSTLQKTIPHLDEHTYLVGHSIGCQTILRYLERVHETEEVGGVVLVAPWTKLKPESYEKPEEKAIAKPWLETPIDWKKIFCHDHNTTCIFSEDDPYVYIEEAEFFRNKLNADIILEKDMGHFTIYDQMTTFPQLLHVLDRWGVTPYEERKRPKESISKG
jgi:predicted alpha/beta hydrolase family esterase